MNNIYTINELNEYKFILYEFIKSLESVDQNKIKYYDFIFIKDKNENLLFNF